MLNVSKDIEVAYLKLPFVDTYLLTRYASGRDICIMMDSFEESSKELIDNCGVDPDYPYFNEPMYLPGGKLGMSIKLGFGCYICYRNESILPDLRGVFPGGLDTTEENGGLAR